MARRRGYVLRRGRGKYRARVRRVRGRGIIDNIKSGAHGLLSFVQKHPLRALAYTSPAVLAGLAAKVLHHRLTRRPLQGRSLGWGIRSVRRPVRRRYGSGRRLVRRRYGRGRAACARRGHRYGSGILDSFVKFITTNPKLAENIVKGIHGTIGAAAIGAPIAYGIHKLIESRKKIS